MQHHDPDLLHDSLESFVSSSLSSSLSSQSPTSTSSAPASSSTDVNLDNGDGGGISKSTLGFLLTFLGLFVAIVSIAVGGRRLVMRRRRARGGTGAAGTAGSRKVREIGERPEMFEVYLDPSRGLNGVDGSSTLGKTEWKNIMPISLYLDPPPNTSAIRAGTTLAPNTSNSTSDASNSPSSHDATTGHPDGGGAELHVLMSQAWFRGIHPFSVADATPTNIVASSSRYNVLDPAPRRGGAEVEGKGEQAETKLKVAVLIAMPSESRSKARAGLRRRNVDSTTSPLRDLKGKGKARASDLDIVDHTSTVLDNIHVTDSDLVHHAVHTSSLLPLPILARSSSEAQTRPDETYLDDPAYANRPNPGQDSGSQDKLGATVESTAIKPGEGAGDGDGEDSEEGPYLGEDGSYELGIASLPWESHGNSGPLSQFFVREVVETDSAGEDDARRAGNPTTARDRQFIVVPSSPTSAMSPLRRPQPAHTRPPPAMRGQPPRVHTRPQPRAPPPPIREDISMWPMNFYGDIPAPRPSRPAGAGSSAQPSSGSSSQPSSASMPRAEASSAGSSSGDGGPGQGGGRRGLGLGLGLGLGRSKKGGGVGEAGPGVDGFGVELSAMSMSAGASGTGANGGVSGSATSPTSPSSTQGPDESRGRRSANGASDMVVNGVRMSEFI